jgi:hypothetical protein
MNLKSRLERLRKRLAAGCAECQGKDVPVFSWREEGRPEPESPAPWTCRTCGRLVAPQHVIFSWLSEECHS